MAMAARLAVGQSIEKTVALTEGFHFASVSRFDDPMFVPGAVKYDDLEGLVRLIGKGLFWLDDTERAPAEETFIPWILRLGVHLKRNRQDPRGNPACFQYGSPRVVPYSPVGTATDDTRVFL
jgi:hypothetical protein